jgi:hypothetical protein
MRRNAILTACGLVLFVFVLARIGSVAQMRAVWTGLPAILVLSSLRLFIQTNAWATALQADGVAPSALSLVGIRLSAQGAGYISIFGPVLSEPMKIKLLGSSNSAAVATLADTGVYWFASSLFGVFGCLAAAVLLSHTTGKAITLLLLAAVFVAWLALIAQTKPLLLPLIRRFGDRSPNWARRAAELEASLRSFRSRHRGATRKMFWLDLGCQLLLAAEVVAVLWVLRIPFHAGMIFAFEAANRAVKMLTGWMPARIGADEGASAALFAVLGLASGAGLALALTRRSRDLLCCAVGFAWLSWHGRFNASQPEEGLPCKP